jgi:hypothetical protein
MNAAQLAYWLTEEEQQHAHFNIEEPGVWGKELLVTHKRAVLFNKVLLGRREKEDRLLRQLACVQLEAGRWITDSKLMLHFFRLPNSRHDQEYTKEIETVWIFQLPAGEYIAPIYQFLKHAEVEFRECRCAAAMQPGGRN